MYSSSVISGKSIASCPSQIIISSVGSSSISKTADLTEPGCIANLNLPLCFSTLPCIGCHNPSFLILSTNQCALAE